MSVPELPRLWTGEAVLAHALEVAGIAGIDRVTGLPLALRDPVRARLQEQHQAAHQALAQLATRDDGAELTRLRAKHRLRKLRGLAAFLNRTDHHHVDGVPCRETRDAVIKPAIAMLEQLARRPSPPRTRPTLPAKETIMSTDFHRPGQVVEEPAAETARREEADAARRAAAEVRAVPELIQRYVINFDGAWASSQPDAVRAHRTRELIRAILAGPERDREPLLTWLLDRQTRRGVTR